MAASNFYKVVCVTKWGKSYCNVGQVIYYNHYCKIRQLLLQVGQSSLKSGAGITNWSNYYIVEQYNILQTTFYTYHAVHHRFTLTIQIANYPGNFAVLFLFEYS